MIELTEDPIDVQALMQMASRTSAGALNIFVGAIRDVTREKKVIRLEYEAYEGMAQREIQKIFDEAVQRWNISGWAFSHRVGTLVPGDAAVVVVVSTPHRQAAFDATQFIMNQLKATVPIWKKEIFEDGEEWVSAHP